ncbi:MAG TPA: class I SAM-dependent methyltransferase [Methanobacterium sp.]|nr:MAG: class I SAM-dependent methyltransferase [Methanobacterium sp.]HOI71137.1 class I SAM-dependent methyltransferase [Methanobacterium sp.]
MNNKNNHYDSNYALDHQKEDPENYWEFQQILKLHTPSYNDKILEIGSNTGEFCHLLKEKFNVNPVGIDINSFAVSIAKKNYPELNFHIQNLFDIKGKFDLIYMQHVIEHIENPVIALKNLKNNLNDEGKLILSCPNKWAYPNKLICWIQRERFCYDPTHYHEFSPQSLTKTVTEAGYKPIKLLTKALPIPLLNRISPKIYYSIPSYLFGAFIFLKIEKNNNIGESRSFLF